MTECPFGNKYGLLHGFYAKPVVIYYFKLGRPLEIPMTHKYRSVCRRYTRQEFADTLTLVSNTN